ncbi:MAG: OstA-like protein [Tenuifilaceae bacterium]|jgi:lipopolysaccharide export system protein LptA|nr:OstA-like protein [Tenuifilaceae bacterium]
MRQTLTFILLFLVITTYLGVNNYAMGQQRREIQINHADLMRNLKLNGKDIRRLIGNVSIKHDEITVTCDSLYDYVGQNRFDAFGNVRVLQENSTLYGDTLVFNGATKTGKVRGEIVRLVDEEVTLLTNFLDFNTNENSVNYFGGGIITTADARFSSLRGKYFSSQKVVKFGGEVAYLDTTLLLNTDSLEYYSEAELIKFFGPTRLYNDSSYLYAEQGWHNRITEESEFHINSFIDNGEQKVFGRSIYYDRASGLSRVIGDGCVIDTVQRLTIFGQNLKYNNTTEYAEVTENPLAMYISDKADTLFLRANKLVGKSVKDTIQKDSTLYNILVGTGDVRFFREDIQGVCDSITFHSVDSILYMYVEPILWNDANQLTANDVNIMFRNENIYQMNFKGTSFIASQEDSTRFNQIKGRDMVGHFTAGKLSRLDVSGNGETVYFIREKDEIVAVNKAVSSALSIGIRDNQVISIMFRDKPIATLYPIDKVELPEVMVKGFTWHAEKRPESKNNIIPQGLNINFSDFIEKKANRYRILRKNPAVSIEPAGLKYEVSEILLKRPQKANTHLR